MRSVPERLTLLDLLVVGMLPQDQIENMDDPVIQEESMIARHWRGWTTAENAGAYEAHLKDKALPSLKNIPGYRGGYVLRRDVADGIEFVVINLFDSLAAVQAFAGPDYSASHFEPEARLILAKVEPLAYHYEVCTSTV